MVNIQTIENIKLGSRITFYNGIYAIITGIFYIFLYNWIMFTNFRGIGEVWEVFTKYNPKISGFILHSMILKGLLIIGLGIAILYLSSFILKKKEKTAWVSLFIIGLTLWGSLLVLEIFDKNLYTIIISFVGWLTFIVGMLIPIKYYTHKNYEEY